MADPKIFQSNPAHDDSHPWFVNTILDQVTSTLIPQGLDYAAETLTPAQPGYRPSPEEMKGFEQYTEWFTDSQSPAQTARLKARITENDAAAQRIGRHGTLWTGLAAAALDPVNYAIPMLGAGQGVLRGALLSGTANAVGAGLQTWATTKVSPTEHLDDAWANALYAGAFAGVLGGYIGRQGRGVAQEMGTFMAREAQAADARVGGVSLERTAPDAVRPYEAPQPVKTLDAKIEDAQRELVALRDSVDPADRAKYSLVQTTGGGTVFNVERVIERLDEAIASGRQDLIQLSLERARARAEEPLREPGLPKDSPKYEAAQRMMADSKARAVAEYEKLKAEAAKRGVTEQPARGAGQADQTGAGASRESGAVSDISTGGNVIQFPGAHMDPNMPVAMAAHAPGDGHMIVGNLALKLEQELHPAAKSETAPSEAAGKEPPKKKGGGKGGGGGDDGLPPKGPDDPLLPANHGGVFKVEPTGPDGYGLAPAYGVEKVLANLTLGTRMINTKIKAVGDILQRFIGEGSVLTTDNLKGIASPNSVLLASKQWQAIAMDAVTDLKRIWTELRGHGPGLEIGGLNVSATGTQLADAYRGRTRGTNPDNMPTWGQFKDMLHAARTAQDPAAYLNSLDPSVAPFVARALPALDRFFDQTGKAAVEHGLIKTKEFVADAVRRDKQRMKLLTGRIDELQSKPDLTPNEAAELHFHRAALSAKVDQLSKWELANLIDEQSLADKVNEIQSKGEARKAAAADQLDKIKAQLVTQFESQMALKAEFEARLARGDTLSDKQFKYLEDLRKKYDGEASAPRDIVDAYKAAQPIEPMVRNDPKFDPPQANDNGLVIDKWEGRKDALAVERTPEEMHDVALNSYGQTLDEALGDGWGEALANAVDGAGTFDPKMIHEAARGLYEAYARNEVKTIVGATLTPEQLKDAESHVLAGRIRKLKELPLTPEQITQLDDVISSHANRLGSLVEARHMVDNQRTKIGVELPYETGKPAVFDAFHGTTRQWIWDAQTQSFAHFDNAELGSQTEAGSSLLGHFFSRDPRTANRYAGYHNDPMTPSEAHYIAETHAKSGNQPNVIMGRVRLDNPFVHDFKGGGFREETFFDLMADAKKAGHDGVIFKNVTDGDVQDVIYAAFAPESIRYRFDPGTIRSVEVKTGVSIERQSSKPKPANDSVSPEQLASAKQRELMADLQARIDGPALTKMQQAYVDDMLDQIGSGRMELHGPGHDPNYLPRVWDHDAVNGAPDELIKIFEDHYRSKGEIDPRKQAVDTVAAIQSHDPSTQIPDDNGAARTFRPSPSNARVLDIPTELVRKFVVTDVEHLALDYARAYGAGIESAKAFGDPFAHDALADVRIQAARELTGTAQEIIKQVDEIGRQLDTARDFMLGRQRAGTPLTTDAAAARVVRNFVSTTSLGGVGFTAVIEAARPLMTRGILDVLGSTFDILGARKSPEMLQMSAGFRSLLGEFGELAHGTTASRVMEGGGWTSRVGSPTAMAIDKKAGLFNELAEKHFYIANGLAGVTDFLKNWSMYVSVHFMVDDVKALAAGRATQKQIQNLAGYGIDAGHAARMVATDAFAQSGRVNIVDLGKFNDPELVATFAGAVHKEIRRTINTPGYFDKSLVQQGFYFDSKGNRKEAALATLPFQFMAWGISANNKVLMSALQGRDANAFMGAASMVGMAYFVNNLKYGGGMQWQNMDQYDKMLLAVEQSGVLAQFSDLNGLIETASQGAFGARPLLGMEPKWGRDPSGIDAMSTPFGPAGAKALDIYKMFDPQSPQDEWTAAGRRIIPFGGLPYTKGLIKLGLETSGALFQ